MIMKKAGGDLGRSGGNGSLLGSSHQHPAPRMMRIGISLSLLLPARQRKERQSLRPRCLRRQDQLQRNANPCHSQAQKLLNLKKGKGAEGVITTRPRKTLTEILHWSVSSRKDLTFGRSHREGLEHHRENVVKAQLLPLRHSGASHTTMTTTSGTMSRGAATNGGSSGKMMPRPASHRNHATLDQLKSWVLSVSIVPWLLRVTMQPWQLTNGTAAGAWRLRTVAEDRPKSLATGVASCSPPMTGGPGSSTANTVRARGRRGGCIKGEWLPCSGRHHHWVDESENRWLPS